MEQNLQIRKKTAARREAGAGRGWRQGSWGPGRSRLWGELGGLAPGVGEAAGRTGPGSGGGSWVDWPLGGRAELGGLAPAAQPHCPVAALSPNSGLARKPGLFPVQQPTQKPGVRGAEFSSPAPGLPLLLRTQTGQWPVCPAGVRLIAQGRKPLSGVQFAVKP